VSTSSKQRRIPGPKSRKLAQRLRQVESKNVTFLGEDFPVFWESARGAWVTDVDGNRFLDLTSAFAVASLGHSAASLQRALQKQSKKIWHGMGDVHPNAVKVELLEALKDITPGDLSQSILSSSGAEAVESALKTARLATGKPGVIAFEDGYHGLTYGTLAVTDRDAFRKPFADQIPAWAVHSPFPDPLRGVSEERCLEALERYLKGGAYNPAGAVGAILVEPMQGRGGIRIPKPFFLKGLREMASRYSLVLIADEIFTGFGRTGRDFAVDHSHVVPDLLCGGKALANGFPLSVCIGTPEVMQAWPESDGEAIHTSTFLGNPLGCAMGLAALREFRSKHLSRRSATLGETWKKRLEKALGDHPRVAEIRGAGLMLGIELVRDRKTLNPDPELASRVITECLQQGLIVLSGGGQRNVLSLTPPLTVAQRDLDRATRILEAVLNKSADISPAAQAALV
jgi:4-aminobutyrate aminotransferase-like enzyme